MKLKINKKIKSGLLGFVCGFALVYSLNSLQVNKVYGSDNETKVAVKNNFDIRANGENIPYDSYLIDGYTYLKLRDFGEFTPITINWNDSLEVIDIDSSSFIEIINFSDGEVAVGLDYFEKRYYGYEEDEVDTIYERLKAEGKYLPYVYTIDRDGPNYIAKYDGTKYVKDFECHMSGSNKGGIKMPYDDFVKTLYPKFAEIIRVNEEYIAENLK